MADVNFLVAFAAGIFSFLSPCVLPLIPSYLSFVSGVSLEEMRSDQALRRVRSRVVLNSIAFILGFSLVFVSLGASASYLGSLFLGYRNFIRAGRWAVCSSCGTLSRRPFQNSRTGALSAVQSEGQTRRLYGLGLRGDHLCRGLDPLCRTDPRSHSRAGWNFRGGRSGYLVALDLCRRSGRAIFSKRASN